MSTGTHLRVDLTTENPLFSRVWNLMWLRISSPNQMPKQEIKKKQNKNTQLFLRSFNIHQHPIQPEYALLQRTRVVRHLSRFCRSFTTWLALDHNIKVDKLFGECRHIILKAKRVFADGVCCEYVVTLTLACAIEDHFFLWIFYFKVYVERTT